MKGKNPLFNQEGDFLFLQNDEKNTAICFSVSRISSFGITNFEGECGQVPLFPGAFGEGDDVLHGRRFGEGFAPADGTSLPLQGGEGRAVVGCRVVAGALSGRVGHRVCPEAAERGEHGSHAPGAASGP